MYRKVDEGIIARLRLIVGKKNVITEREKMIDYSHDEYSLEDIRRFPEAVIKPADTGAVSEVVKLCNQKRISLTPRGGGTGLCGGCVPVCGGIVMSLENMNKIIEVDKENLMATAEAGATLMDFYRAVEKEGLFFPPHPGDESATVGGVIATNAGGSRAVKYGVIRNFVRGIEVVFPGGEIEILGGKFIKNSSGYSLLHLLIGSEGTLGIVTKAVISLLSPPGAMYTLVVPYNSLAAAIGTVPAIIQNRILPMAVEFAGREPIKISEAFLDRKWPCPEGEAQLMIIIDGSSEDEVLRLAETVGRICLDNQALDVFIADSKQKQENILEIRSQIYEAMKNYMLEILDISIPRARIADFVADVEKIARENDIWLPTYGHAADGNLHTHIMNSRWEDGNWKESDNWREKYPAVREKIHQLGREYQGMVSGEHGIGLIKKEFLPSFIGGKQIALMRAVKNSFDPHNVLNPGKILD